MRESMNALVLFLLKNCSGTWKEAMLLVTADPGLRKELWAFCLRCYSLLLGIIIKFINLKIACMEFKYFLLRGEKWSQHCAGIKVAITLRLALLQIFDKIINMQKRQLKPSEQWAEVLAGIGQFSNSHVKITNRKLPFNFFKIEESNHGVTPTKLEPKTEANTRRNTPEKIKRKS